MSSLELHLYINAYLNLGLDDPTVGAFLNDHVIRAMISVICGGHMGALSVSEKFFRCADITAEKWFRWIPTLLRFRSE
jgi:hypothetical protein